MRSTPGILTCSVGRYLSIFPPFPTLSHLQEEHKVEITPIYKVKSLLCERYPIRLDAPKAHALSPRTLELCRQFGLDVNEIRGLGTGRQDAFWVNFVTHLSGQQVGRLPYERMDPGVLDDTPTVFPASASTCSRNQTS